MFFRLKNFFKNLLWAPIRVKKISAVTHNSYERLNEILNSNNQVLQLLNSNNEVLQSLSQSNNEVLQGLSKKSNNEIELRESTRKILILGTSNSLFREGWVTGLKQSLTGYDVTNLSVGASQGFQFSGVVSIEDFSKYDYVFFDSLSNEESYCLGRRDSQYKYTELEERLLYELMSTIASQTNLIVMGFCKHFVFDEESEIFKSRRKIAQNVGGYFFDIRKILKLYMKIHNLQLSEIYDQSQHAKREISYEIGEYLGDVIKTTKLQKKAYSKNFKSNFYCQTISIPGRIQKYQNSMMPLSVSSISKEDSIKLNKNYRCVGFYLNAVKTNCYVECSYNRNSVQEVSLLYEIYNPDAKNFQKVFVGLQDFPVLDNMKMIEFDSEFKNLYIPIITCRDRVESAGALELSEVLYWDDKNCLDLYDKDIFSYDESMLITYKVISKFI